MLRWLFFITIALNLALFAWFEREQQVRNEMADRPDGGTADVAKLTLLSEVTLKLRERASSRPDSINLSSQAQQVEAADGWCVEVKNFPSQQAMLEWQARLPADVAVMTSDSIPADEYWVYIESPDGLRERQELLQELRAMGLEVSVIQRGQFKGNLSLGRYKDRELAMALYEGVLAQGRAARMLAVATEAEDLSLWLSVNSAMADDLSWLDKLLLGTGLLKSEKKVCEGVASGQVGE